ncbi:MAG: hypothetical protein U0401_13465 [Anaerolineae bacterium]
MSLAELLASVEFLVDADGKKKAAVVEWPMWEELLTLLEDLEDAEELRQARQEDDELIPWEQVKAKYLVTHPEANV